MTGNWTTSDLPQYGLSRKGRNLFGGQAEEVLNMIVTSLKSHRYEGSRTYRNVKPELYDRSIMECVDFVPT